MMHSNDAAFFREYKKALKELGSQRAVCAHYGIARSTLQARISRITGLQKTSRPKVAIDVRKNVGIKRFIFSSAQDNTQIHSAFMDNLEAYAKCIGAEIHIAGFTYNKSLFTDHSKEGAEEIKYAPRVVPYLTQNRFELGPNLMFCGEMNTLPTAVSPLSGFETYTREKSGIFPHVKVQHVSVPVMKGQRPKHIMTTGAVTMPNYVQKRAGIKATFHHIIGAVIAEVDTATGEFFARHLIADDDGSFYDLDTHVKDKVITGNNRVLAINWGDLHHEKMDTVAAEAAFGKHGMLSDLKPAFQIFHDVLDFGPNSHHNINDPYQRWLGEMNHIDDISKTIMDLVKFLNNTLRKSCSSYIVESNHDQALTRWMMEANWKNMSLANARLFFELHSERLKHMDITGADSFSPMDYLLRKYKTPTMDGCTPPHFVREDEGLRLFDIEFGIHGHRGANGAKGTPRQFTKMGPKANTGHTHSPGITDGIYTAGTLSQLDMGYNKGLSSWSHTHIVTYQNGKRTLVTTSGKRFKA